MLLVVAEGPNYLLAVGIGQWAVVTRNRTTDHAVVTLLASVSPVAAD